MDDLPALEGELYAGLVLSDHSNANITVDASVALTMEGVVDYVCVDDVPGTNIIGIFVYIHTLSAMHYTANLCTLVSV